MEVMEDFLEQKHSKQTSGVAEAPFQQLFSKVTESDKCEDS